MKPYFQIYLGKFTVLLITILLCAGFDANSQNCSPTLKEIYNFQIGNVFQYVSTEYTKAGGAGLTVTTTTKLTITGIHENNDTLKYFVLGIENVAYSCDQNEIDICDTPTEYKTFEDTLVYIESAAHFLNGCDQQLVTNFFTENKSWLNDLETGPIYTKIQISESEGRHLKTIGGGEIYVYQSDSLVHFVDEAYFISFKEVYAEGLGRIDIQFSQARYNYHKYLEGYVKDGDTTGVVTSDPDLLLSSENTSISDEIVLYPNPCKGLLHIKSVSPLSNAKIELFDSKGIKVLSKRLNDSSLDISFLQNGIYFVRLTDDTGITYAKTIAKI